MSVGIGTGKINRTVHESDGTAFTNSGRILDAMKGNQNIFRISVSANEQNNFNRPFHYACSLLELIISQWTQIQAERTFKYLIGESMTSISRGERKSLPSISESLKLSHVDLVKKFPEHIKDLYYLYIRRSQS